MFHIYKQNKKPEKYDLFAIQERVNLLAKYFTSDNSKKCKDELEARSYLICLNNILMFIKDGKLVVNIFDNIKSLRKFFNEFNNFEAFIKKYFPEAIVFKTNNNTYYKVSKPNFLFSFY